MILTLNKNVKWREDREAIFICDCKRLIDLKIPSKYLGFMKRLDKGIQKEKLSEEDLNVLEDFEKMNFLSILKNKKIKKPDFNRALKILDNELGEKRVRNPGFLEHKFKKYPKFFIGVFLDKELIGVIFGFPREDYLLISEIAIDGRFQRRGFGKKLVRFFEKVAIKEGYHKINVGAEDSALKFYRSLGYTPFLLVQFDEKKYSEKNFKKFETIESQDNYIKIKIKNCDFNFIKDLRKKYPKAYFQYIFTKELLE